MRQLTPQGEERATNTNPYGRRPYRNTAEPLVPTSLTPAFEPLSHGSWPEWPAGTKLRSGPWPAWPATRLVETHQKQHPFSRCHSCPKAACLRRPGCGVTTARGAGGPRSDATRCATGAEQRDLAGPSRPLCPQQGSRGEAMGPPSAWRLAGPESQVGAMGPSTGRRKRTRWPQGSSGKSLGWPSGPPDTCLPGGGQPVFSGAPPTVAGVTTAGQGSSPI